MVMMLVLMLVIVIVVIVVMMLLVLLFQEFDSLFKGISVLHGLQDLPHALCVLKTGTFRAGAACRVGAGLFYVHGGHICGRKAGGFLR